MRGGAFPSGRGPRSSTPKPRSEGNVLTDGFTTTGRRPTSRPPGDIMSNAAADRVDERAERWAEMGIGDSRTSRIYDRTRESGYNLPVGPLDDNEDYY